MMVSQCTFLELAHRHSRTAKQKVGMGRKLLEMKAPCLAATSAPGFEELGAPTGFAHEAMRLAKAA